MFEVAIDYDLIPKFVLGMQKSDMNITKTNFVTRFYNCVNKCNLLTREWIEKLQKNERNNKKCLKLQLV